MGTSTLCPSTTTSSSWLKGRVGTLCCFNTHTPSRRTQRGIDQFDRVALEEAVKARPGPTVAVQHRDVGHFDLHVCRQAQGRRRAAGSQGASRREPHAVQWKDGIH